MCTKARLLVNGAVSLGVFCMVESTVSFLPCVCALKSLEVTHCGATACINGVRVPRGPCFAHVGTNWTCNDFYTTPFLTMYGSGLPVDSP